MSHFREFEKQAIRTLALESLGSKTVDAVLEGGDLISYEYSGIGYFLTVRHSMLPNERAVFSSPVVVGRAEEYQGAFLVFVEAGELMLECYTAGALEIPSDFRERNVHLASA